MAIIDAFLDNDVSQVTKRETYIAIRRDGGDSELFGDGSPQNPYDGSTAVKLARILDPTRVPQIAFPNTRFIFGPGIYRTGGGKRNADGRFDWLPLPGQEFIGSGIFATTLRLEVDSPLVNTGAALLLWSEDRRSRHPGFDTGLQYGRTVTHTTL
jgi:hypothetical protein